MTPPSALAVPASSSQSRQLCGWTVVGVGATLGGGAAAVGVGWQVSGLVGPVLGALGAIVAAVDLRTRTIPNGVIVAGGAAAVAVAVTVELVDGRRPAVGMLLGAAVAALPLLVVHLAVPTGMGFGDVKWAAVMGALLGVLSIGLGAAAVGAACFLGAVGAVMRLLPRRSIPLGACLAVTAVGGVAVAGAWP